MKKSILSLLFMLPVATSYANDDYIKTFIPENMSKIEFKQKIKKLGGKITWNNVQYDNTTGCVDEKSATIQASFPQTTGLKQIKGWFYNNKLTTVSFDINDKYETVYKNVSAIFGKADKYPQSENWKNTQPSEWNKSEYKVYSANIGSYSSVIVINNRTDSQRVESNKSAFKECNVSITEEEAKALQNKQYE